jgi:hypothetical protein
MSELIKKTYANKGKIERLKPLVISDSQFQELYVQKPQPLKIGDGIKLKNDARFYEIIEFLEDPRGTIKIKEISCFSGKIRFINCGQINEVL